jgi:hypothetical protein
MQPAHATTEQLRLLELLLSAPEYTGSVSSAVIRTALGVSTATTAAAAAAAATAATAATSAKLDATARKSVKAAALPLPKKGPLAATAAVVEDAVPEAVLSEVSFICVHLALRTVSSYATSIKYIYACLYVHQSNSLILHSTVFKCILSYVHTVNSSVLTCTCSLL